jgi:DNA-binding CsgD family transcriptional regulator
MLTAADLQTLSDATLKLYSPSLHANNWVEHAFEFILKIVSADMINYGNLDPQTGDLVATTTCDRSNWGEAVAGFGQFMKLHPFFCFDPTVNEGKPFFRSDFISSRQFRDLAIYSECFRILETLDHAAVHVPTDDGRLAWFAAERGGRRNFTERDRLMLTLGQQHLINSRKLAVARTSVRDEFKLDAATFSRAGFTPREADVAHWLVEGKSNQEIATLMKIQLQTVKTRVSELFNKTGTSNRLALTLHLIDLGRKFAATTDQLQHVTVRSVEHYIHR